MFDYLHRCPLGGNASTHLRRKMLADVAVDSEAPGHENARLIVMLSVSMLLGDRRDDVIELFTETGLREAGLSREDPL